MNQQPDKFFHEKLEGYQKPVPSSAWEKIISAERKKKHRAIWLNIAASVLPLMLAGYILWPVHPSENNQQVAEKPLQQAPVPEKQVAKNEADKSTTPLAQRPISKATVDTKKSTGPKRQTIKALNSNGIATVKQEANKIQLEENTTPANEENNNQVAEILPQESVTLNTTHRDRTTVTLVYTASDVSQYLDKNTEEEATSSTKKPSTFQKLLKKANDLSAQDPLGELRQKKNEILALNFKGKSNVDKTSKQ